MTALHVAALALAAFAAGFALSSALGVRSLRALRAERDAVNAAAGVLRNRNRNQARQIAQLRQQGAIDAANAVQLASALGEQQARGDLLSRFSWN